MDRYDPEKFRLCYLDSVEQISELFNEEMQKFLSVHCYDWRVGAFDFPVYLRDSLARYLRAYERLLMTIGERARVCELGGFLGAFPLTLARLGYETHMTETLKYYGSCFDALFAHLTHQGVKIHDFDPFDPHAALPPGQFDFLSVMAVLEHYPHSLQTFMSKVSDMLSPEGRLYMEVPNIASLPKRIRFLLGRSPLVPIGSIYRSAVPFVGHHHEFTRRELGDLIETSGFTADWWSLYNYSAGNQGLLHRLMSLLVILLEGIVPDSSECIAVCCRTSKR